GPRPLHGLFAADARPLLVSTETLPATTDNPPSGVRPRAPLPPRMRGKDRPGPAHSPTAAGVPVPPGRRDVTPLPDTSAAAVDEIERLVVVGGVVVLVLLLAGHDAPGAAVGRAGSD